MKLEVQVLLVFVVLLVYHGPTAWSWVIFTSFPYEFNSSVIDVKVQIRNITGHSTLDMVMYVLEDIEDVDLDFAIALEGNEGNYTTLVNRSANFCKFLKNRNQEPFLRILYEDFLKSGNFFITCPVKKGSYSLKDYHFDDEIMPSYLPESCFFVELRTSISGRNNGPKVKLFSGRLHGKIDKTKGFNNLKMFSLG